VGAVIQTALSVSGAANRAGPGRADHTSATDSRSLKRPSCPTG